jgi:hypothetical protein
MPEARVIAHRAEFIDVLNLMRGGRLLVRSDLDGGERCLVEGSTVFVYATYGTLAAYGLIEELPLPPHEAAAAPHLHWYRLSPRGREFAHRAWAEWKARPLWQRCLLRLTG